MAKNSFGKILAGVTIIGAGVALGLAIFNKLDTIRRELENDEFEDDFDDEEEGEEDFPETEYVTINPAAAAASESNTDNTEEPQDNSSSDKEETVSED